jgi:hypothetical protein
VKEPENECLFCMTFVCILNPFYLTYFIHGEEIYENNCLASSQMNKQLFTTTFIAVSLSSLAHNGWTVCIRSTRALLNIYYAEGRYV